MQPVLGRLRHVCRLLAVGRPEPRLRDAWETTRRRENRMRRSNYIFRMSFLICSLARRRAQTPYVLSCCVTSTHVKSEGQGTVQYSRNLKYVL